MNNRRQIPGYNDPLTREALAVLNPYIGTGYYDRNKDPNFTGRGDQFVQFNGGQSFADENQANEFFQFTIQNHITAPQAVFLTPGLLFAPGGTPPQGTLKDATLYASVEGTASALSSTSLSKGSIQEFHAWIYANPTRIVKMLITSNQSAQADLNAEIVNQAPFRDLGSRPIRPGGNIDGNTYNDKRITYDFALQADNQTKIKLYLAASSTATITLEIGAILNQAAALNTKAMDAHRNIQAAVEVYKANNFRGRR